MYINENEQKNSGKTFPMVITGVLEPETVPYDYNSNKVLVVPQKPVEPERAKKTQKVKTTNNVAVIGFVLSLALMFVPPFSALSLIFSIIGLNISGKREGEGRGLSVAGIIISLIAGAGQTMFITFSLMNLMVIVNQNV